MGTLGAPAATYIFGRVFDSVTNSYKFFWLRALLSAVEGPDERDHPVSDLLKEMVVAAWHPVALYRLSLGRADQLKDAVKQKISTTGLLPNAPIRKIREALADSDPATILGDFVPYRFIAPWFQLTHVKDQDRNDRIRKLAAEAFGGPNSPPYCFEDLSGVLKIRFEPKWRRWMQENAAVLHAFADHGLTRFLQARNPSVPGIPEKLRAPLQRNLALGRMFWTTAFPTLSAQGDSGPPVRDIYTSVELGPKFQLDHFLPWTFVAHDLLWNLVPVSPSANAAKGDSVPDLALYIPRFALLHHTALQLLRPYPKLLEDHTELLREDTPTLLSHSVEFLTRNLLRSSACRPHELRTLAFRLNGLGPPGNADDA